MRKVFLIFYFSTFLVVSAKAASPNPHLDAGNNLKKVLALANKKNLSESQYWRRLLHYRRNFLGIYRSEIDDMSFFLSNKGRSNPQAELGATITGFLKDIEEVEGPDLLACQYPARYAWLDEQLQLSSFINKPSCPRFQSWKDNLSAESVSLIFSSYYLNNPASMYGHTFLKLGRRGYLKDPNLMDYTVNYAAVTNSKNGLLFAIRGLSGGYPGRFSTTPYYMQIQKYNNMESRDLWEYELNLSQPAIDRLVEHLWELGSLSMSYFFLNKNCSYQLFPLLEVADPSLNLSKEYVLQTVPLDTLRSVLNIPSFVKAVEPRPSHVKLMLSRRNRLKDNEIRLAEKITLESESKYHEELQKKDSLTQSHVLASAHDLLRFKSGFFRDQPREVQDKEREILLQLKNLKGGLPVEKLSLGNMTPPHEGHKSSRFGLGWGINNDDSFEEISLRPALHDLESNPTGFDQGSQLEMFHLRLRYMNDRKKLNLEEFTLIEILSLTPYDRWVHPVSWHVRTGAEVARDLNLNGEESLSYRLAGGSGLTAYLFGNNRLMGYLLWHADSAVGSGFDDGYRMGLGGNSGVLVQAAPGLRYHFNTVVLRYPLGNVGNVVKFQLIQNFILSKNSEFRATLERQNSYKEALFNLNLYF